MSIDRWMDKQIVVQPYNEILLSNKKEQYCANFETCNQEGESKLIILTEKSQAKKEYILYDSIYIKF